MEEVEKLEKIKKKHNVFKRLHASKKAQVLFFIITMSALLLVWVIVNVRIYNNPILLDDDFSWVYQFEIVNKSGETVEITGWAFPVNEGVSSRSFEIILSNLDCQQYIFTEMDFCLRNDVNSYFLCDIDYSKSGFNALVDAKM